MQVRLFHLQNGNSKVIFNSIEYFSDYLLLEVII